MKRMKRRTKTMTTMQLTDDARLRLLLSLKFAVRDFYKKPENMAAFEEWKRKREEAGKNESD